VPENRPPVILFVDDQVSLRTSVQNLLQMEGFEVLLAANGREALRQLEQASPLPDLIVSDISMPHMSGFELFEAVRLRPEWFDIPFVFSPRAARWKTCGLVIHWGSMTIW